MKRILTFILIAVIGITAVNAQTDGSKRKPKKQTQQAAPAKPKKALKSATVSQGVRYGSHYYVDLGLPSGTKWATTNVGASRPYEYGNYYTWGETSPKNSYDWSDSRYCLDSTGHKFSKYVTNSEEGNVDGKQVLDLSDDAAYVNWGKGWRLPSLVQIEELIDECEWIWTSMGGHNGYKVVGPNGNSMYLPAAGSRKGSSFDDVNSEVYCLSLSMFRGGLGWEKYFLEHAYLGSDHDSRCIGVSARPVLAP